jgi:hypothetical protein
MSSLQFEDLGEASCPRKPREQAEVRIEVTLENVNSFTCKEATAVDCLFEEWVRPKSKGVLRSQPYFARSLEVKVLK